MEEIETNFGEVTKQILLENKNTKEAQKPIVGWSSKSSFFQQPQQWNTKMC